MPERNVVNVAGETFSFPGNATREEMHGAILEAKPDFLPELDPKDRIQAIMFGKKVATRREYTEQQKKEGMLSGIDRVRGRFGEELFGRPRSDVAFDTKGKVVGALGDFIAGTPAALSANARDYTVTNVSNPPSASVTQALFPFGPPRIYNTEREDEVRKAIEQTKLGQVFDAVDKWSAEVHEGAEASRELTRPESDIRRLADVKRAEALVPTVLGGLATTGVQAVTTMVSPPAGLVSMQGLAFLESKDLLKQKYPEMEDYEVNRLATIHSIPQALSEYGGTVALMGVSGLRKMGVNIGKDQLERLAKTKAGKALLGAVGSKPGRILVGIGSENVQESFQQAYQSGLIEKEWPTLEEWQILLTLTSLQAGAFVGPTTFVTQRKPKPLGDIDGAKPDYSLFEGVLGTQEGTEGLTQVVGETLQAKNVPIRVVEDELGLPKSLDFEEAEPEARLQRLEEVDPRTHKVIMETTSLKDAFTSGKYSLEDLYSVLYNVTSGRLKNEQGVPWLSKDDQRIVTQGLLHGDIDPPISLAAFDRESPESDLRLALPYQRHSEGYRRAAKSQDEAEVREGVVNLGFEMTQRALYRAALDSGFKSTTEYLDDMEAKGTPFQIERITEETMKEITKQAEMEDANGLFWMPGMKYHPGDGEYLIQLADSSRNPFDLLEETLHFLTSRLDVKSEYAQDFMTSVHQYYKQMVNSRHAKGIFNEGDKLLAQIEKLPFDKWTPMHWEIFSHLQLQYLYGGKSAQELVGKHTAYDGMRREIKRLMGNMLFHEQMFTKGGKQRDLDFLEGSVKGMFAKMFLSEEAPGLYSPVEGVLGRAAYQIDQETNPFRDVDELFEEEGLQEHMEGLTEEEKELFKTQRKYGQVFKDMPNYVQDLFTGYTVYVGEKQREQQRVQRKKDVSPVQYIGEKPEGGEFLTLDQEKVTTEKPEVLLEESKKLEGRRRETRLLVGSQESRTLKVVGKKSKIFPTLLDKAFYTYGQKSFEKVAGSPELQEVFSSTTALEERLRRMADVETNEELARLAKEYREEVKSEEGFKQKTVKPAGGLRKPLAQRRFKTETPEFKEWFGKSVVVNEDGSPKVMYHATSRRFKEPNPKKAFGLHLGTQAQANFVVNSESKDEDINADRRIYPLYAKIKNPLRLTDPGINWGAVLNARSLVKMGIVSEQEMKDIKTKKFGDSYVNSPDMVDAILDYKGYDGVVYLNRFEPITKAAPNSANLGSDRRHLSDDQFKALYPMAEDSYLIFNKNQIKSAIANKGTYSSTENSILAQRRLRTETDLTQRGGFGEQLEGEPGPSLSEATLEEGEMFGENLYDGPTTGYFPGTGINRKAVPDDVMREILEGAGPHHFKDGVLTDEKVQKGGLYMMKDKKTVKRIWDKVANNEKITPEEAFAINVFWFREGIKVAEIIKWGKQSEEQAKKMLDNWTNGWTRIRSQIATDAGRMLRTHALMVAWNTQMELAHVLKDHVKDPKQRQVLLQLNLDAMVELSANEKSLKSAQALLEFLKNRKTGPDGKPTGLSRWQQRVIDSIDFTDKEHLNHNLWLAVKAMKKNAKTEAIVTAMIMTSYLSNPIGRLRDIGTNIAWLEGRLLAREGVDVVLDMVGYAANKVKGTPRPRRRFVSELYQGQLAIIRGLGEISQKSKETLKGNYVAGHTRLNEAGTAVFGQMINAEMQQAKGFKKVAYASMATTGNVVRAIDISVRVAAEHAAMAMMQTRIDAWRKAGVLEQELKRIRDEALRRDGFEPGTKEYLAQEQLYKEDIIKTLKTGFEEMMDDVTFQKQDELSKKLMELRDMADQMVTGKSDSRLALPYVKLLMFPFMRTPAALLRASVKFTPTTVYDVASGAFGVNPLGLAAAPLQFALEMRRTKGNVQESFQTVLNAQIIGHSVMMIISYMMASGAMAVPPEPGEEEDKDKPPFSIRVSFGGKTWYQELPEPLGAIVSAIGYGVWEQAQLEKMKDDPMYLDKSLTKDIWSLRAQNWRNIYDGLFNDSFIGDIYGYISPHKGLVENVQSAVGPWKVGGLLPFSGLVRFSSQLNTIMQQEEIQNYVTEVNPKIGDMFFSPETVNKIAMNYAGPGFSHWLGRQVEFLDNPLYEQIDIFGHPLRRDMAMLGEYLPAEWLPIPGVVGGKTYVSPKTSDQVELELYRLGVQPDVPSITLDETEDRPEVFLSPEVHASLVLLTGSEFKRRFKGRLNSPFYQNKTEQEKKELVAEVYADAKAFALKKTLAHYRGDLKKAKRAGQKGYEL